MDRKHCSPLRIPPGFGGKVLNRFPSASLPVNIPFPQTMKSAASRDMHSFSPAVAASAPSETIPYVDMLLNSSTERRSLSPDRKIASLQNGRVRVLSCSDLESTLTSRSYEGSKSYQNFPPPPPIPIFHHLPSIQACSPPRFSHRTPVRHNFPPLNIGQQAPGQSINRGVQPVVRPPPGFEVPLLNTPPSPLTPPQFPSPQPWSPARLAPMFHRTESTEPRIEQDVSKNLGGARVQSTPPMPRDSERNNKRNGFGNRKSKMVSKSNEEVWNDNPTNDRTESTEPRIEQDVSKNRGGARIQSIPIPRDSDRNNKRTGFGNRKSKMVSKSNEEVWNDNPTNDRTESAEPRIEKDVSKNPRVQSTPIPHNSNRNNNRISNRNNKRNGKSKIVFKLEEEAWYYNPITDRTEIAKPRIEKDVSKNPGGSRVQSTPIPHDSNRDNKRISNRNNKRISNRNNKRISNRNNKRNGKSKIMFESDEEAWYDNPTNHRTEIAKPRIEKDVSKNPGSARIQSTPIPHDNNKNNKRIGFGNGESKIMFEPDEEAWSDNPPNHSDWTIDKSDEAECNLYKFTYFDSLVDEIYFKNQLVCNIRTISTKFKNKSFGDKFEPYLSSEEVKSGLADRTLIESMLRINHKNSNEAYVSDWADGDQDVVIMGVEDRNRSLDGDIVVVRVKEKSDWAKLKRGGKLVPHKTGQVVYIKERVHHRNTIGSLYMLYDEDIVVLEPRDTRLPYIRIQKESIPKHIMKKILSFDVWNILFKASITSWVNPNYAEGIFKKKIGKRFHISTETAAILEELGLDCKPVPHFKKLVPPLPYEIPEDELVSRLDLRSQVIFTIDPPSARDLDDAVSIKKINEETFQVGVHISDVSHFLEEGTKLDKMVSNRATTIYMVEEVFHMLPLTLCELCSLSSGQDKLTISVIMTVSKEGVVLDTQFKRSVIHSCGQLTYDQVQDVIEGKDADFPEIFNNVEVSAVKEAILQLHELAVVIRAKRFDSGALKIDQPKLFFTLNEDKMPKNFALYETKDSNKLIEEFMLLANESVAKFIHDKAPDLALLRKHDPPKLDMISRLADDLNEIGILLDYSSAGSLNSSLLKYCEDDKNKAQVLYNMCAKPMRRAVYFCSSEDTHHYALNMNLYTHFTSPIRRYADVIVHRILTACLELSPMPPWDTEKINKFATVCNRKKFSAKKANELSCDFHRVLYFKKFGPLSFEAIVLSVTPCSIFVIVPCLDFVSRIQLNKMKAVKFKVGDNKLDSRVEIKWPKIEEAQELKIFSPVKVSLDHKMVNITPQVIATLLPPSDSPS